MSQSNDVIVAAYPLKEIEQARAHRDRLIAEGKVSFLTSEMGELRYSGIVNVHVVDRTPRISKIMIGKREPEDEPDGTMRGGITRYRRMAP